MHLYTQERDLSADHTHHTDHVEAAAAEDGLEQAMHDLRAKTAPPEVPDSIGGSHPQPSVPPDMAPSQSNDHAEGLVRPEVKGGCLVSPDVNYGLLQN